MSLLNRVSYTTLLFTLSAILLIAGCSNPAGDDHEEHHATGAVLEMNGAEVVRIEEGEIIHNELEVNAGEETPLITIYFLNDEGERFQPHEDDHFRLEWDQIDTTVAEIEQHAEDGRWSFHLVGISEGNTGVRFRMWHEDEDHSDYDTPTIPITIN